MAFLSTVLKKSGHEALCIDGSAPYREHTNEDLVAACDEWKPDILCVTATSERIKFAYHLLALLRNRFGESVPIIAGRTTRFDQACGNGSARL
jgi:hypothetical protein